MYVFPYPPNMLIWSNGMTIDLYSICEGSTPSISSIMKGENGMDKYDEKVNRIMAHLEEHPHDWQSKVALLVANSDRIEHRGHARQIARLKEVARIRKERLEREERELNERNR